MQKDTIPMDIVTSMLNELGQEINNPTPMVSHTGLNRPLTLDERVDRMLAIKLSKRNVKHGGESLDEAQDFAVDDEFETEPLGEHDFTEMQEEFLNEQKELEKEKALKAQSAEPVKDPQAEKGQMELPQSAEIEK